MSDFMEEQRKESVHFTRHWHVYQVQQAAFLRMVREAMVPGMLVIIMDFAVNYSHDHQVETQSEFLAQYQATEYHE